MLSPMILLLYIITPEQLITQQYWIRDWQIGINQLDISYIQVIILKTILIILLDNPKMQYIFLSHDLSKVIITPHYFQQKSR